MPNPRPDRSAEMPMSFPPSSRLSRRAFLREGAVALGGLGVLPARPARAADPPEIPPETPDEAKRRHERVAERLRGTDVICHRGASEHAHENTLEALRAT